MIRATAAQLRLDKGYTGSYFSFVLLASAVVAALSVGFATPILADRLPAQYVIAGGTTGIVIVLLAQRTRLRVLVLGGVVFAATLNFAPALFSPINLAEDPSWTKALKDGLLLVMAALILAVRASNRPGTVVKSVAKRRFAEWLVVWTVFVIAHLIFFQPSLAGYWVSLRYYVLYPWLSLGIINLDLRATEVVSLLRWIAVLGAMQGVIALANFFGLVGVTRYANYVNFGGQLYPRAIGTMGNPNNLSLFLCLPALLLMRRPYLSGIAFGRMRLPLLISTLIGIFLTFSKTAITALGLVLAQTLKTRSGRRRTLESVFVFGFLTYLVALGREVSSPSFEELFGSRVDTFPMAIDRWLSSPTRLLFGEGIGKLIILDDSGILRQTTTDNMLLTLALESGVIGLLAFSYLVYKGIRLTLGSIAGESRHRRANVSNPFQPFVLPYLILFLVFAVVAPNFRLFPAAMFFWIIVALGGTPVSAPTIEDQRVNSVSSLGP